MKKLIPFLILILLLAHRGKGQEVSTTDKRAVRHFEKARQAYYDNDYNNAVKYVLKAIERDTAFLEPYLLASEIHIDKQEPLHAIAYLEKMLSIDAKKYPRAWSLKANLHLSAGHYDKAIKSFDRYLSFQQDEEATHKMELARYRQKQIENPLDIHPENLGDSINTEGCEYVNALTLDGSKIYFTRKPQGSSRAPGEKWDEDFYFSVRKNEAWQQARSLGEQINTPYNEGAMHLAPDGRSLFYASCRGMQGYGSCDLYYATRINDTLWKEPFNLGPVLNTRHWETQPCFSSDGRTLFFVSTRPGGEGGADIWRSTLKKDGSWEVPENLGETINTKGEEMAPYLHPDGRTLYFSSDGHRGMGGQDIFVTRMQQDSSWSKPENMGYPVNTKEDQINLVVDAAGTKAYISSQDTTGYGCYDIYEFRLPQKLRPRQVAYLKGSVFDRRTGKPLTALLELRDLQTDRVVVSSSSGNNGRFMVALPNGRDYALHVNKTGYMFYSEHFPFRRETAKPLEKDIFLEPVNIDAKSVLNNIFFAFDSDSLKPESLPELKKLRQFLAVNDDVKIRIEGHTDNMGGEEYNKELSQQRADAVKDYLRKHGIAEERLQTKGFGESQPRAGNETAEGRAKNRRTEIRIIAHRK
jgi:outer membrane protein OmpA-like peptidoglycan-associated protein/Tol biopolymer transport system component